MMNDLSDEAFIDWRDHIEDLDDDSYTWMEKAWQECRSRAEAEITTMRLAIRQLQSVLTEKNKEIEALLLRERKAFEAGYDAGNEEYSDEAIEEFWRAYKEQK